MAAVFDIFLIIFDTWYFVCRYVQAWKLHFRDSTFSHFFDHNYVSFFNSCIRTVYFACLFKQSSKKLKFLQTLKWRVRMTFQERHPYQEFSDSPNKSSIKKLAWLQSGTHCCKDNLLKMFVILHRKFSRLRRNTFAVMQFADNWYVSMRASFRRTHQVTQ